MYSFVLQLIPLIGQSILLGCLSQYFCEKNSLEEELSALRTLNNSELVDLKEEEIQTATRDAYLYAIGLTLLTLCSVFSYTWTFYYSHVLGMMHRVVMIGAIYSKVCVSGLYMVCVCVCRDDYNGLTSDIFQTVLLNVRPNL